MFKGTVSRSTEFMVSVWVSYVRSLQQYGSCVWKVKYLTDARGLESLQRRWTREIYGMLRMEYVDWLCSTSMYYIDVKLHRIHLVIARKIFHSNVDLALEFFFEVARVVDTKVTYLNWPYQCADQKLKGDPL